MIKIEENENEQQEVIYKNPMERYGSAIIKLTDPKKNIDELELYFAGQVNEDGKIITRYPPMMNDKGIRSVIGQIKAFANQSGIFSELDDGEIKNFILDSFSDTLIKDLMLNKREYDITNPATRDIIVSSSRQLVFLISKRAKDGADKRFWAKIQHEFHQFINAPQKKPLLDRMNTWSKKNM